MVVTTTFFKEVYAFADLGFDVLIINFTGSFGLGITSANDILGRVGDIDVNEVHYAAKEVATTGGYTKVVATGGSHGGFIVAHLMRQYPEFYKGAAFRNPVINIAGMCDSTDIPDYNFCEALKQGFATMVVNHQYQIRTH